MYFCLTAGAVIYIPDTAKRDTKRDEKPSVFQLNGQNCNGCIENDVATGHCGEAPLLASNGVRCIPTTYERKQKGKKVKRVKRNKRK